MYNFYVDPSWRKKELTPKRRPKNFVQAGKFLRSVQLLSRSKLTRPRGNFYVVETFYVDLSWRQEEIILKYQRDNFAPARKFPLCVRFLRRSQLAPKESIPRCQRDLRRNFTQHGHCLAGAKLSCWYFRIISSWRQHSST